MGYLLHHLLSSAAATSPERPAVVDGDRTVTYADLEVRSNQLAQLLIELGVGRGDRVGIYLDKSFESVLAIYGILKCGAAYVPLDPQAPGARLAYMARDCGLRILVTGHAKRGAWGQIAAGGSLRHIIVLDVTGDGGNELTENVGIPILTASALDGRPVSAPSVESIDQDLAYILYTSGSTGEPKGVMLSHRNALTFVAWAVGRFGVDPQDRLSSHAPLHFDLSVFDLFGAAASHAVVVLVPATVSVFPIQVARFIDDHAITIWYSVPSILSMLTERANLGTGDLPSLRTVLFAGEVFPTKYLRRLMHLLPHVRFFNLYGPTETNVCTHYEVAPIPEEQTETVPIGRAIDNVEVFAVTDEGRIASPSETGELYVRGGTVMRGYWGDRERTDFRLVTSPLGAQAEDDVYMTGDLVREDEDGNYRLLGRRDSQIKSRGYRIELGEIETALYSHPAVLECAVTAVPDDLFTNRIKAHVVTRDPVSEAQLARFCAERIPRYMVPEFIELRDSLPKTSTGKVDKVALAREVQMRGARS